MLIISHQENAIQNQNDTNNEQYEKGNYENNSTYNSTQKNT